MGMSTSKTLWNKQTMLSVLGELRAWNTSQIEKHIFCFAFRLLLLFCFVLRARSRLVDTYCHSFSFIHTQYAFSVFPFCLYLAVRLFCL